MRLRQRFRRATTARRARGQYFGDAPAVAESLGGIGDLLAFTHPAGDVHVAATFSLLQGAEEEG